MVVLVTGASGFVGLNLCQKLAETGFSVVAQTRNKFNRRLLELSEKHRNIKILEIEEIHDKTIWQQSLHSIDYIVHLAAIAHRRDIDNAAYNEVNHLGTAKLLQDSIASGTIKRFIFISTIGVHGNCSDTIIDESSPISPTSAYAVSKYKAECIITKNESLDWCILRPTLMYGRENLGNMKRLIDLIKKGVPLPFGSIKNKRSFLNVLNLCDAITVALLHENASRKTFCISDTEAVSFQELLALIATAMNVQPKIVNCPINLLKCLGTLGDMISIITGKTIPFDNYSVERLLSSLVVSNARIRHELRWTPVHTIHQGLKDISKQSHIKNEY